MKHLSFYLFLIPFLILTGCGGGGGGNSFVGAAIVSINAQPSTIDTGDRMMVEANVSQVNESGIALKFKYPPGLSYVADSATLVVDGQTINISPQNNVTEGNFTYLVFYLSQANFGKGNNGQVQFFLEGNRAVLDGQVQVDADVDNSQIDNTTEFDPKNPQFDPQDQENVNVRG